MLMFRAVHPSFIAFSQNSASPSRNLSRRATVAFTETPDSGDA